MTEVSFIEEYNALFVRFVQHIASLGYDRCLMTAEGRPSFKFNTQDLLNRDLKIFDQFTEWPEWIALDKKVQESNGKPLNQYYVFCHQFSDILNSINFVKTNTTPKLENILPDLVNVIHDQTLLNKTLISGYMNFRGNTQNRYAVLIQGLKHREKIELESYGYFDSINSHIKECSAFWHSGTPQHLYSAFYTDQENLLNNGFICRLMTAIRTYIDRDVRFDSILVESTGITGEPSYSTYNNLTYREDTALFGTDSPRLMSIRRKEYENFSHHMLNMITGLQYMELCCEYYNYSKISLKHLQVSSAFIAIESIFPSKAHSKQEALARNFIYLLGRDDKFGELIKKYYQLRSKIVHGNKEEELEIREKINNEHPGAPSLFIILQDLFIKLAARNWNPAIDCKPLRKAAKK